ncbi:hypothetical protein GGS26DRAFT_505776 [Hypomontagnella submonticulosa]|nr:hypothetical protein GGS26DRAFT_505776 [Hypomontagnella submonticulosa]
MESIELHTPAGVLKSLFHHVALPAKLPQGSEHNINDIERSLVDRLIIAAKLMRDSQDGTCSQVWESIRRSLALCRTLNIGGKLERSRLASHLRQLVDSDLVILHITAQNAGLMIYKPVDPELSGNVLFEAFEASPKRESVLASQTLSWTFPGTAVLVPASVFYDDAFLENLSAFLEQASVESTQKFSEYAKKAGHAVAEDRENPDPALITSLLTAILEANGKRVSPILLRKRVRDDVCWFNSATPWRRLPYWLVLRVSIARYLATMLGGNHGRIQYKFLMCIIHGMILNDTQDVIALEDQAFLQKKLCRRLYKLDRDHLEQAQDIQNSYASLIKIFTPQFNRLIDAATARISDTWENEKKAATKVIPPLPRKASREDQRLSLICSRQYLEHARKRFQNPVSRESPRTYTPEHQRQQIQAFGEGLLRLFDKERQIRGYIDKISLSPSSSSARVLELHDIILDYIRHIDSSYDNNAEQKSIMLLTLMGAWKALDEAACAMFPLLYDFHPVFTPRLIEALRLPLLSDMARARKISSYIQKRISRSGRIRATLFDDPCEGCFAERYFDNSPGSSSLAKILADIQLDAEEKRKMKEREWELLSTEYERLTREYDSATCIYVQSIDGLQSTHDAYSCPKCQIDKRRSHMSIRAFESPLPESTVMAKAVVFELKCPEALAFYRDATWMILYRIANQAQDPGVDPKLCLEDYSGLQQYAKVPGSISLASLTKSFLMTHYKERKRFPVELDQVCLPNGLKLAYFDTATRSWPGRKKIDVTFEHHYRLTLPKSSPFSSLVESQSFHVYGNGPSSYEISASYSSCPPTLNPHEFMAFQSLLSGKRRRWVAILTELGSSNLNLSTETTVLLFDHLIHQIGSPDESEELLGNMHYIFKDSSFCEALLQQLKMKLEAIASNWRETHLMEIVIMLTLRLVTFTAPFPDLKDSTAMGLSLLSDARSATLLWVRTLRKEMYRASHLNNLQNCQSYLLWAALLCKRTFALQQIMAIEAPKGEELSAFIECSTAVYDNIPDNIASLGRIVRNSFIRDLRMTNALRDQIHESIRQHGRDAMLAALKGLWPAAESNLIQYITFTTDNWVRVDLYSHYAGPAIAHYNYLFGILLINGQPLGRLPTDSKNTIVLEELFGSQTSLMKYPSSSPGMTHVLAFEMVGYQIHVGYDGDTTIIRAMKGRQVLELVPRETFYNGNSFDLPAQLVFNCIHWLDPVTGILEIRPKSRNIWKSHPHNWKLDITTSMCSRFTPHSRLKETLINPYCPLFIRVSRIFMWFEKPMYLTIYQPAGRYAPVVEMHRMQLRWFVNRTGLLQSSHLQVEIDPHQDIDTWYGLDSKLICRSIKDPLERSVLIPLAPLAAKGRGCHVQVLAELPNAPSIHYIRFTVNRILGRIDCAAEPTLVYRKAEIHALTSFILPDPLTGLTGVESSLAILSSGLSQPWTLLNLYSISILHCLSKLSPVREYYPEDLQVMKKETWNTQLPTRLQREEFHILISRILSQSTSLSKFRLQKTDTPELSSAGDSHLNLRALRRRQLYERSSNYELKLNEIRDTIYESRHHPRAKSLRYSNVLEAIDIIRRRPAFMSTVDDLALHLSQSLSIKGYRQNFEQITLHDRLSVDVRREWGPLVNAVKEMEDQYKIMFFMGIISFRSDANMHLIRTLIAFSLWGDLQLLNLPDCAEYCSFRPGQMPQLEALVKLIEPFQAPPPEDPPLIEFANSKTQKKLWQARVNHTKKADADCRDFAQSLLSEWPAPTPSAKDVGESYLLDVPAALEKVRPEWERLYQNHEFYGHLKTVQTILNQRHSDVAFQRPAFVPSEMLFPTQQPGYSLPTLGRDLMRMPVRRIGASAPKGDFGLKNKRTQTRQSITDPVTQKASRELGQIIEAFSGSKSTIKERYASDLKESLNTFKNLRSQGTVVSTPPLPTEYTVSQLEEIVHGHFTEIEAAVQEPNEMISVRQMLWLAHGQLYPAVTPITILEQLRSTAKRPFGSGMREKILRFAVSITSLQRQKRMQTYQRSNEYARYEEERTNVGHRNWRVEDYPDWLLLEVESNLLIRETQVQVALAMITPESGANSVLQLNMGQGKTSCIIPMVAVLLADGRNLVRVSVPKALLQQTAQLLHGRLGGLVGREISHVPFSRRTSTKEGHIKLFHDIHRDIQRKRGVMLCLPEHQMSFMLSGLQRVLDQQIPEANMMIRVLRWLKSCARDVLDECDHTLAVKTQLIYPSGSQMAVDGHPHRWVIVEQVLGLVDMHLYNLADSYPHSIEVVRRSHGGFPFVFFLRADVEEEMINRIKYDICRGIRGIIPMDSLDTPDRIAIKEFLSGGKVRQSSLDRINHLCPDRPHIRQTVYLLRGLFVHRILIMALKKRYGVQYGLHPSRDPVAVPFHAKGVPSEQSEFGHVDVAILLTTLAFYYCGISIQQTRQALEAVLKSDDPASEYDKWTDDEGFPDYLKDWHSINVDDSQQISQIWSCVRFKVSIIDYFMNNFVFPPHAKQFRIRLQTNGWDIPLLSGTNTNNPSSKASHNRSRGLTTGFSGTNDIKPLLPLTIKQDDLPSLSHTNAEVLTYLLQPRSRRYVVMEGTDKRRLTEDAFLLMLRKYNIRILIDSGAQILELSNKDLADKWLKVDGRATVALYFEGDSPLIISKQGTTTPLLASPYADNLDEVLVYLDEAHTRGTDLKFGPTARAALTLGLGQTKDHTVQAAMRLRQLGTTQSVMFFAPPEVNQSIRDLCGKKDDEPVDSHDVIRWLINNTCEAIEQLQPLYYSQGVDFCNRTQAAEDFPDYLLDDDQRKSYIDAIKHKERQTLQQLYGPQTKPKTNVSLKLNPQIAGFVKELDSRKKTFQDTGQAVHASALQEVEQERETEVEVEAVRQVKKPMSYTPHKFSGLHKDLETFAKTGRIPAGSDTFIHILKALARTALGRKYKTNPAISSSQLFVSSEFERTVKLIFESANDNFMRPVQWILYAAHPEAAVVVTPEEAELLIQIIRETESKEQQSATHILTYAAPVTRRMIHFNKLNFYAMPPLPANWQASQWLTTELGFFAGRLYFDWSEYSSICELLGIDASSAGINELDSSEIETTDQQTSSITDSQTEATSDELKGSQNPTGDSKLAATQASSQKPKSVNAVLTHKPYTFTREYLAARRYGQDFTHTPMGFVCNGKPLNKDSKFFRQADTTRRASDLVPMGAAQTDDHDVGDEANESMDLGTYDPSARLQDDEDEVYVEYDESDMRPVDDEANSSDTDDQPAERDRGKRLARRGGRFV